MLAGTKTVDAMINAAAGIGARYKAADFDLVGIAAFGAHTKRAEDSMRRLKRLERRNFRAPAPAPERDLVFVGGVPA